MNILFCLVLGHKLFAAVMPLFDVSLSDKVLRINLNYAKICDKHIKTEGFSMKSIKTIENERVHQKVKNVYQLWFSVKNKPSRGV